jgi:hypothetical protein
MEQPVELYFHITELVNGKYTLGLIVKRESAIL